VAIEGGVVDGQQGGSGLSAECESIRGVGGADGAAVVIAAAAADDGKSRAYKPKGGQRCEEREANVVFLEGNRRR
jgi:hypothetical protein